MHFIAKSGDVTNSTAHSEELSYILMQFHGQSETNKHVSSKSSVVLAKVNFQSEYIHGKDNLIAFVYRIKFTFWFHHPSIIANALGMATDGLKALAKIRVMMDMVDRDCSSAVSGEPNGTKNRSEATEADVCGDWRIVALSTTQTIKVVLTNRTSINFMVCF